MASGALPGDTVSRAGPARLGPAGPGCEARAVRAYGLMGLPGQDPPLPGPQGDSVHYVMHCLNWHTMSGCPGGGPALIIVCM